ncbi:arginase-1-like [Oppia nitens]|uniref:arginase-1-like n=1 Tax=Oppia nitens TaxID=1686743 RepID=UPI0023DB1EA7|nr:arginase-1-like [Oppia nitens]
MLGNCFNCAKFANYLSLISSQKNHIKNCVQQTTTRCLSLGIIGAPTAAGQSRSPGVQLGPRVLRDARLIQQIQQLGHDVRDYGDIGGDNDVDHQLSTDDDNQSTTISSRLKNERQVQDFCGQLASMVLKVRSDDNRLPLIIGGDHSVAIGSITGNSGDGSGGDGDDLCVIWVDAHADINTARTTTTGHFHGMPVSFLIRQVGQQYGDPNADCLVGRSLRPSIDAQNIAYIGLRDLEPCELKILNDLGIRHFSMADIDRLGIYEVVARALAAVNPRLDRRIHCSFDVDSVDPSQAPSTGTPVAGGLTLREAQVIGEEIGRTGRLAGLDFVELNPQIGSASDVRLTIDTSVSIILSFLGKSRLLTNRDQLSLSDYSK